MSNALSTPDQTHDEAVAKMAKLIDGIKVCMFTTSDEAGRMASRPVVVLDAGLDGDLWFVTHADSRKVTQVRRAPDVHVAFASARSWVSLVGTAEIMRDVAKAKQLWSPAVSAWFPEGPDAPGIVLVKVAVQSAEYWDSPGAIVASALSFVKTKLTGEPYKVEHDKADL